MDILSAFFTNMHYLHKKPFRFLALFTRFNCFPGKITLYNMYTL